MSRYRRLEKQAKLLETVATPILIAIRLEETRNKGDMGKVTVIGGAGFVGRYLIRRLAEQGHVVRIATRDPEAANYLKPMGGVGQIQPIQANIRDNASIFRAISGSDCLINLAGVMFPRRQQSFQAIHEHGALRIARAAVDANVAHFIHISALGLDTNSKSKYTQSKAAGEAAVRAVYPNAIIIRPSIIFGPEDKFFNLFARIATLSPIIPLFGGGQNSMQPVYVGDVARAIAKLTMDIMARGRTYELGGPQVLTMAKLMEKVCLQTGRNCFLMPLPFVLAKINAFFLQLLPGNVLTMDQVEMLKIDNVLSGDQYGLADIGLTPTTLDSVLPTYLHRYRKTKRISSFEKS